MKTWKILTLAIALVSVAVPLVAGFTTWLSAAVKAGVVALAPPVAVATGLVLYFNWRARFKRQILADHERGEAARPLPERQLSIR